jgi:molecular chaperone DnaK (HSP70)
MINIEELFKQKNLLSDDALINNTDYSDNAFYAVGGACFYGINLKNNIFSFKDISHFNLGIKTYNDTLYYLTKKGDIIPIRNKETIKIGKSGELELYEEDNKTKEKKLIGKFDIDNNINYNENKLNYNEITIEYELNEDLNLTIKIFTGENFSKEINCKLFL